MAEKRLLTIKGLQVLEAELDDLKVRQRKEVAEALKEARAQGDLSENAEYDAAKEKKSEIEGRIEELENLLKNVEVVADEDINAGEINLGCTVKVWDMEFEEELEYKIVGSTEAASLEGKISNESPMGKALMKKHVGDEVDVETQDGIITFKVLEITRTEE